MGFVSEIEIGHAVSGVPRGYWCASCDPEVVPFFPVICLGKLVRGVQPFHVCVFGAQVVRRCSPKISAADQHEKSHIFIHFISPSTFIHFNQEAKPGVGGVVAGRRQRFKRDAPRRSCTRAELLCAGFAGC